MEMIPGGVDIRIGVVSFLAKARTHMAKFNRFGRLSHQLVQAHTLNKKEILKQDASPTFCIGAESVLILFSVFDGLSNRNLMKSVRLRLRRMQL